MYCCSFSPLRKCYLCINSFLKCLKLVASMRSCLVSALTCCITRRNSLSRSGSCFFHFPLPYGCQSPSGKVTKKKKIGKLLLLFCPGNRVSLPKKKDRFSKRKKQMLPNMGNRHICKPKYTCKKLSREKKIANTMLQTSLTPKRSSHCFFLSPIPILPPLFPRPENSSFTAK